MTPFFITAIDTDAGKTVITGLLAHWLEQQGHKVITLKLVQTGCEGIAEDLRTHRQIQNRPLLPEDKNGLTSPYVFPFAASPHLSARLEHQTIEFEKIDRNIFVLSQKYPFLIIEGVGGLCVPLTEDKLVIDFIAERRFPTFVVTSGRLGSINHTLLTLRELARSRIPVDGIVYNHFPIADPVISVESKRYFRNYDPAIPLISVPVFEPQNPPLVDFSAFFKPFL